MAQLNPTKAESWKGRLKNVPRYLKKGVMAYLEYPKHYVTGGMWPSAEGMSFITGLGEGTAYSYPLTLATGRPEFLLLYVVIPPLRAAQAYCSRLRLESHGKN